MSKHGRSRKVRMSVESFVHALVEADFRGECRKSFASRLGFAERSVYQRCYQLQRMGVRVPVLPGSPRMSVAERAKMALAKARRRFKCKS